MFSLFANLETINPENALVQTNAWTWLLLIGIFLLSFVYNGLIWGIFLKLTGNHTFLRQGKFYYSTLTISIISLIVILAIVLPLSTYGFTFASLTILLINLICAKYWWKLSNKLSFLLGFIVAIFSLPWLIFLS